VALAMPALVNDNFSLRVFSEAWLLSTLVVGTVITVGYAGIFNLSQATFYGLGAYTTAILVTNYHFRFEFAIVVAVAWTAICGVAVGTTALRIRGDYWSLVSMALTVAAERIFADWRSLTGGLDGFIGIPILSFAGVPIDSPIAYYYSSLAVLLVSTLLAWRLLNSFAGRAMMALKHDEATASMMGISTGYFKLLAMGWSAGLAGLAGAALVAISGYVYPTDYGLLPSFNILIFAIVGGVTGLLGPIAAAVSLTGLIEEFRGLADYQYFILGGALVLAIFVRAGVFEPALRPIRNTLRPSWRRVSSQWWGGSIEASDREGTLGLDEMGENRNQTGSVRQSGERES
jgi:branched-chain amino acid transport system permease protein